MNEALVKQSLIHSGSSPHSIKHTLPQGVSGPPFQEGIDSVLGMYSNPETSPQSTHPTPI